MTEQYFKFHLIFDMTEHQVVDTCPHFSDAVALAQSTAKERLGNMIVVMAAQNAYHAIPVVSEEYLFYPPMTPDPVRPVVMTEPVAFAGTVPGYSTRSDAVEEYDEPL